MICSYDNLAFQILSIGRYEHNKGRINVPRREYAALSFRTEGQGKFCVQKKTFTVDVGDICFIPAGADYEVDYSGGESIVAHLIDCNYDEAEVMKLQHAVYIGGKFSSMLSAWEKGHQVNQAKANVYDILQAMEEDRSNAFDDVFVSCLHYLQVHYHEPSLKVSDICQKFGISESGLYRRFVMYLDQTPKEYLQGLRLRHAVDLLLQGKLLVKEVAFQSGFGDEKYFSRFIRKKLGHSPSYIRE